MPPSSQTGEHAAIDCLMLLSSSAPGADAPKRKGRESGAGAHNVAKRKLKVQRQSPVRPAINLRSNASMEQLRVLAATFKICPRPSHEQIEVIAARLAMSTERLTGWFASRLQLQAWVDERPDLRPENIAQMFYSTPVAV